MIVLRMLKWFMLVYTDFTASFQKSGIMFVSYVFDSVLLEIIDEYFLYSIVLRVIQVLSYHLFLLSL